MTRIIAKNNKIRCRYVMDTNANILLCFYIEIKPLELPTNRVSKERATKMVMWKVGLIKIVIMVSMCVCVVLLLT